MLKILEKLKNFKIVKSEKFLKVIKTLNIVMIFEILRNLYLKLTGYIHASKNPLESLSHERLMRSKHMRDVDFLVVSDDSG